MSELVVWVIFFVLYLIFQVLGNKKRPKNKSLPPLPGDAPGTEPRERPATLAEALREIQEALQNPQRVPETPPPAPEPVQRLPPRPAAPKPTPEFHNLEAQFQREMRVEREGIPARRPTPSKTTPTLKPVTRPAQKNDGLQVEKTRADLLSADIKDDLKDPEKLKRAWLLKEILDEPAFKRFRA